MVNTEAAVIQSHNCMHQYVGGGVGRRTNGLFCNEDPLDWTALTSRNQSRTESQMKF